MLVFQGKTFLEQVTSQVAKVTGPIVLVGGTDFSQHELPNVMLGQDENPDSGPLEGIRVGLKMLEPLVEYAFVTSCDVPLIKPELIQFLISQMQDHTAIVPRDGNRIYGMTAIYKTSLWKELGERVKNRKLRVSDLATAFDARIIEVDELKRVDANLDSMTNINTPADYAELLERFGLDWPSQMAPLRDPGTS